MEKIDLNFEPFFEVGPDSKVELFINGVSRMVSYQSGPARLYCVFLPCGSMSDGFEDPLPF